MSEQRNLLVLSTSPEQLEPGLELLRKRGIKARCIDEPYRFVASFASEKCDLIILDAENFRKQEIELLRAVREVRPDCGAVVLVDRDQRDLASWLLLNGADIYLVKPVTGPELLEAVDRASRRIEAGEGHSKRAQALSTFAEGVSQKINDALAIMKMSLQMAQQDLSEDPNTAKRLAPMNDEIDRVANLSHQLLGFARQNPRAGQLVDMRKIVADLGRVYESQCRDRNIEVKAEVADDSPLCPGDETQLRQACDAILEQTLSAMSHMNGRLGKIEISCRPRSGGTEIVFQDNGPRIPKEILPNIFDPLHAGRRSGAREMGLAMAWGLVESHGGRIDAYSDDTPTTRFTVWLPARK